MQTQYFGLNIINCDYTKTQAALSGSAPATCPAGCAAGVVKVGATCSAVYELAYTQLMALQQGPSFNLSNVNPYGISSLCRIPLSQEELNAFYQTGLIQHFYNKVRASDPSIPCDPSVVMSDATTLSIAQCELALAHSPGTCPSNCTSLVSKIGASCLVTLANKVASMDPTAYNTTYSHLHACGISASAPVAAPASPPSVPQQPVTYPPPVSKQTPPVVSAPVAVNATSGAPHSSVFVTLIIIAGSVAIMLV
jgi:hypothetical protein